MKSKITFILTLAAMMILAAGGVWADDYYVANTGNDLNDGSSGSPWLTIQHAVDSVLTGDTINVAAGTYNEDVTVNESLTLNGAQVGVDARARSASESEIVGVVEVTSAATNVVFDGFKFTSPTRGFHPRGFNLHVESENSTIKNCIFVAEENAGHDWSGYLDFGGITNTTVERNSFSGDLDPTQEPNVILLGITGAGTVTVADNEMHDVGGGGGVGIMCSNDDAVINIEDNEFDNTGDGIWIWTFSPQTFSVSITGNDIHSCSKNSVKLVGASVGEVHINCNNMYPNTGGLLNEVGGTVDAEYNWWGSADGPGGSGPGSGDPVSDNVDFDPWLDDEVGPICPPFSHFTVYEVEPELVIGGGGMGGNELDIDVELYDQFFGPSLLTVKKAKILLVPVSKDDEEIVDGVSHLVCYELKDPECIDPMVDVKVVNQFNEFVGEQVMEVKKLKYLCVPSTKEVVPAPEPEPEPEPSKKWCGAAPMYRDGVVNSSLSAADSFGKAFLPLLVALLSLSLWVVIKRRKKD